MEGGEGEGVRIFIGGLGEEASSNDLRRMLETLGAVESVEIVRSKGRSFAYINFLPTSPKSLARLFSTYNGCIWKGGRLRLEKAKENYLVRLKREWAEDTLIPTAAAATETGVDVVADNKKELLTEKSPLKLFFPKSRKVKKIPFGGTGKHKYSFRRVSVPSLPKHFCDCEEHSPPVADAYAAKSEQVPVVEQLGSGVNVQELDMMNSVMNELFGTQNAAGPAPQIQMPYRADSTVTPINNEPQLEQNQEDSTSDEDNLIINLVSQGKGTSSARQGSSSDKRNASKFLETEGTLKKQRTNVSSPNSQSRPVCGELSSTLNLKETSDASLDASRGTLGTQLIQPESGFKQSTPTFSWSQKSSWKKLVGDNTAFSTSQSLSKVLPDLGEQSKSDNAPNSPDSDSKNLGNENQNEHLDKRKAVAGLAETQPVKPDISFSNSVPRVDISTLNLVETSDASRVTQPESGFKQSIPTFSWTQKSSGKKLVGDNTAFNASQSLSKVLPDVLEQPKSDNAPNSPDTDSKNLGNENHKEVLDKREALEGLEEAQPTKPDISFGNSGRGSGWLHTCSWTQLIGGNNSGSFSIRQVLPGVNLEEQEPAKQDRAEVYKLPESKHGDTTRGNKSQPKAYAATQMKLQNAREMKKQNFVVNNPSSASVTDTKHNPAAMEVGKEEVAIGETCSFMRNAASLKEWSRTKAAISGSRKRTSNEK